MKRLKFKAQRRGAGFSLVEVALAVAIASLGIITCLGLLPEGLEMSRKTGQMTINRNIIEQVIRDLENVQDWKLIKPAAPNSIIAPSTSSTSSNSGENAIRNGKQSLYYDEQGASVTKSSSRVTYVVSADFNGLISLPGATADNPYLTRAVIRIANTSNPSFDFSKARSDTYTTFSHLIAKTR